MARSNGSSAPSGDSGKVTLQWQPLTREHPYECPNSPLTARSGFTSDTMSTNADEEPATHDPVDHAVVDASRYSSVAVDHEETIIYDQQVEDAWIQSNAVEPLDVWQ